MHIRNVHTKNDQTQEITWSGIQLLKLAPSRRHHFSPKQIDEWTERGFVTVNKKTITMHTIDGDMVFKLDHLPSRYCLHCGEALPNEDVDGNWPAGHIKLGEGARKHVAEKHSGKESPNSSYPAGYKYKKYYGATAADSVPTINPNAKQIRRVN